MYVCIYACMHAYICIYIFILSMKIEARKLLQKRITPLHPSSAYATAQRTFAFLCTILFQIFREHATKGWRIGEWCISLKATSKRCSYLRFEVMKMDLNRSGKSKSSNNTMYEALSASFIWWLSLRKRECGELIWIQPPRSIENFCPYLVYFLWLHNWCYRDESMNV